MQRVWQERPLLKPGEEWEAGVWIFGEEHYRQNTAGSKALRGHIAGKELEESHFSSRGVSPV